jgi:hypothetical protein
LASTPETSSASFALKTIVYGMIITPAFRAPCSTVRAAIGLGF